MLLEIGKEKKQLIIYLNYKNSKVTYFSVCHFRFKELLPYEENRVRIIPSKENRTGYINASHIAATVGSQARFYIAAQGPLPATINNFWQMIWEADVYLVVMLTGLHDDDTSADYFPVIGDRCLQVGEVIYNK